MVLFKRDMISSQTRRVIARIFLAIGALGPGLSLLFDASKWGSSSLFEQMKHLPIPLQVFGGLLVFATLLMLKSTWRDVGYVLVAVFYFAALISGIVSVSEGHGTSALVFAIPVLLWVYLEAAISATRSEIEDIDLIAERTTKEG